MMQNKITAIPPKRAIAQLKIMCIFFIVLNLLLLYNKGTEKFRTLKVFSGLMLLLFNPLLCISPNQVVIIVACVPIIIGKFLNFQGFLQ